MFRINYDMIISDMPIVREWSPRQETKQQETRQESRQESRQELFFSEEIPAIPKLKRSIACIVNTEEGPRQIEEVPIEDKEQLNLFKLVKGGIIFPLEKYLLDTEDMVKKDIEVSIPELVRGECGCCEFEDTPVFIDRRSPEWDIPELVSGECGCYDLELRREIELSEEDILAYSADDFTLGKIPEVPPPESMC